ncbi:DUF4974 domain-containing protein [Chitinophaga agrisoli]|uniref:DUF4974 domain-containing protein n=1 Tax=Chitinophaga agrisoli TaxID=2607653 RepID=A0A5B2VJ11_9BACT|nr:FecR domain-containing protein [Chitinophaga agrisoli]KAA2238894.1 DUF4974 domain-containing protein [Chitinophaga agrisoli]
MKDLLKRYVAGQCTPEEQLLVEEWYRQQLSARRDIAPPEQAGLQEQLLQRIQQPRKIIRMRPLLRVAAALVLLLGIGYLLVQQLRPAKIQWQEAYAAHGNPLRLQLSDGSIVWLNAGTRLRYPAAFKGNEREVQLLTGEMNIDVKQDPDHPFFVKSGGIRTRVLGTVFNVRAYERLALLQVTVQQGKVSVRCDDSLRQLAGQEMILLPDEQMTLHTKDQVWEKQHIDAKSINGWTSGRLLFDNERLDIIAMQLEYKYQVKISFANASLAAYRITAGFQAADPLNEVLEALSMANNLHYQVNGNTIMLNK